MHARLAVARKELPRAVRIAVAATLAWWLARLLGADRPVFAVIVPMVAIRDDTHAALSLSLAGLAALAVALLALAREVGVLRLSAGSRGALEIESEGPGVGLAHAWAQAIETGPDTALRLAIFTSAGCPLCAQLTPAVAHVAADPLLAVRTFDEHADALVWAQAGVPGSPYAVALSADGVALAKGTFNSLSQLESVLSTARFRERGLTLAA